MKKVLKLTPMKFSHASTGEYRVIDSGIVISSESGEVTITYTQSATKDGVISQEEVPVNIKFTDEKREDIHYVFEHKVLTITTERPTTAMWIGPTKKIRFAGSVDKKSDFYINFQYFTLGEAITVAYTIYIKAKN